MFTLEQLGRGAGVLNHFHAAQELTERIVEHLAVFLGDQRRNRVGVLIEQFPETEHHPRAFQRRRVAPRGECRLGRRDCLFDSRFRGQCDVTHHLSGRGVEDRL